MYNPTYFNIDIVICENMFRTGFPTLFACIQVTGCVIYCVYLCVCVCVCVCVCERERERERDREREYMYVCVP